MARISLWKPHKDNDYHYSDDILRSYFNQGATGIYVHKYIGPGSGGDETTIADLLFLENRSRKYSDDIYELRGAYTPNTSDFNLSQFGIFISNDTIMMLFHYNDMLDILGRKLMAGDVIELPHLADPDTLDEDTPATHRFYTIVEGSHASEGYGVNWWSHIWRVKAKQTPNAPEYEGIVGGDKPNAINDFGLDLASIPVFTRPGTIIDKEGNAVGEVCCDDTTTGSVGYDGKGSSGEPDVVAGTCDPRMIIEQGITDGIIEEAYADVRFDPKQFDAAHIWIYEDPNGEYCAQPWTGDTIPPNGHPVADIGDSFDPGLPDGSFVIRTDFDTDRLYRKQGSLWSLMERDFRKIWTPANRILDSFIDNVEEDTMSDGTVRTTRKALSKTVQPQVNLHQSKEDELNKDGKK